MKIINFVSKMMDFVFKCDGFRSGSIRPGAAHHLAIKFDICDAELPDVVSGARPACGECVVRLPLTDFVSSNSLHFRELLIHNGLPVTDTGLEEDPDIGALPLPALYIHAGD